jgi:ribosomal protein S18 acetylase RimI-like enzyme
MRAGSTGVIKLVPVSWPWQALQMAQIRNTCRMFLTNDTSYIGPWRQLQWWWSIRNDPTTLPFLFIVGERTVGYGLVRYIHAGWFVSGGLRPQSRGSGLGRYLFKELCAVVAAMNQTIHLEVLETNLRARKLYRGLGFEDVTYVRKGVLLMRKS